MVLFNLANISAAVSGTNPLVPTGWEALATGLSLLALVAGVVALVSLARSAKEFGGAAVVAWTLFIVFFPLLGAALWFLARFRRRQRGQSGQRGQSSQRGPAKRDPAPQSPG